MDNADLLQIKIEKAKSELSEETRNAIHSVDWRGVVADMANTKTYNIEQLGDLELETELLLCGLTLPENYPKELEKRMGISREAAAKLTREMNEKVFKKIKDKMIADTERKNSPLEEYPPGGGGKTIHPGASATPEEGNNQELAKAGIEITDGGPATNGNSAKVESREEILKRLEQPELPAPHPILAQKLSGPMQIPSTKTEHTLENISKPESASVTPPAPQKYDMDPYREVPE